MRAVLLLSLFPFFGFSQTIDNIDLSYKYNFELPFHIDYQVVGNGENCFVLFGLPMSNLAASQLSAGYFLSSSLEIAPAGFIELGELKRYLQSDSDGKSIYGIRSKNSGLGYFTLSLTDTASSTTYLFPMEIPTSSETASPDITLYSQGTSTMHIDPYIHKDNILKVNSFLSDNANYQVKYYDHEFEPALPPMTKPPETGGASVNIDSVFLVERLKPFVFSKTGLYIISTDDSKNGLPIRVEDKNYPKPSTMDDLIEALIYLSTSEEYDTLLKAAEQKTTFDEYWLFNAKSADKAKYAIKGYYNRIKEANVLFTTYKEGWKTDMGMIYTIFGSPDKVLKNDSKETWIYNKTFELSRISFNFVKVNTAFSNRHYILERNGDYKTTWYRAVELWRKGRKEY